ncbi:hypothetical protein HaloA020_15310 [Halomonas sp. A020]|nr:hypothetical protein HaloA020_15310 [Halomonas sp. A020]
MGKGGIVSSQAAERFTGAFIRLQGAQGDGFHGVLSFKRDGADAASALEAPALCSAIIIAASLPARCGVTGNCYLIGGVVSRFVSDGSSGGDIGST